MDGKGLFREKEGEEYTSFRFDNNDVVGVEYCKETRRVRFWNERLGVEKWSSRVTEAEGKEELYFGVVVYSDKDSVEIL